MLLFGNQRNSDFFLSPILRGYPFIYRMQSSFVRLQYMQIPGQPAPSTDTTVDGVGLRRLPTAPVTGENLRGIDTMVIKSAGLVAPPTPRRRPPAYRRLV